jgi:hypothetical protein
VRITPLLALAVAATFGACSDDEERTREASPPARSGDQRAAPAVPDGGVHEGHGAEDEPPPPQERGSIVVPETDPTPPRPVVRLAGVRATLDRGAKRVLVSQDEPISVTVVGRDGDGGMGRARVSIRARLTAMSRPRRSYASASRPARAPELSCVRPSRSASTQSAWAGRSNGSAARPGPTRRTRPGSTRRASTSTSPAGNGTPRSQHPRTPRARSVVQETSRPARAASSELVTQQVRAPYKQEVARSSRAPPILRPRRTRALCPSSSAACRAMRHSLIQAPKQCCFHGRATL